RAWTSPFDGQDANESKNCCSKKQPAPLSMKRRPRKGPTIHDDLVHDSGMLGDFLSIFRNRSRPSFGRSRSSTQSGEAASTRGAAPGSIAQVSGAFARDGLARHEHGRDPRPALADAAAGLVVRQQRVPARAHHFTPDLSFCVSGPAQIVVSKVPA